jgi:regulatory protein
MATRSSRTESAAANSWQAGAGRGRSGKRGSRQIGSLRDGSGQQSSRQAGLGRLAFGQRGSGQDDPEAVARLICLQMLTAAPRTKAQLAAALKRRGVPDEAAAAVLGRFAEVKLIDDASFARAWVESRHHGRGLAGRALGAELRQRGVAQEDIRGALDELGPEQELATARELVARRLPATSGLPFQARMRRLTGVLARKGYPAALAYRVAREALEQELDGEGRVPSELADLPEPEHDDEAAES